MSDKETIDDLTGLTLSEHASRAAAYESERRLTPNDWAQNDWAQRMWDETDDDDSNGDKETIEDLTGLTLSEHASRAAAYESERRLTPNDWAQNDWAQRMLDETDDDDSNGVQRVGDAAYDNLSTFNPVAESNPAAVSNVDIGEEQHDLANGYVLQEFRAVWENRYVFSTFGGEGREENVTDNIEEDEDDDDREEGNDEEEGDKDQAVEEDVDDNLDYLNNQEFTLLVVRNTNPIPEDQHLVMGLFKLDLFAEWPGLAKYGLIARLTDTCFCFFPINPELWKEDCPLFSELSALGEEYGFRVIVRMNKPSQDSEPKPVSPVHQDYIMLEKTSPTHQRTKQNRMSEGHRQNPVTAGHS